jgi:hypothetical protein
MSLRALLDFPAVGASSVAYTSFQVYNTSKDAAENGGQCCLWTVPAGVIWAAVELWGGGGGGSGARCCQSGWAGGSGSYSRKIINQLVEGDTYRICAAGSTNCSQDCFNGCAGNPSYVFHENAAINVACASGGSQGRACCQFHIGCSCQGCAPQQFGSFCGSFGVCGVTGGAVGSPMCSGSSYQFMPSAPFTMGGMRATKDTCSGFCGGCCAGGYATWPGGGGATASSHTTGPFCGAAGSGGLVTIFYSTTS